MHMNTKYTLFRRNGIDYSQDWASGQQKSLRTRDEAEALKLINARNEAHRQPVLNLQLARAYLTASDPAFVERTWQSVIAQLQARGKDTSRLRYASVFKSSAFDGLRHKRLMETSADDFLAVFKDGKVSVIDFLKRLHNFAVNLRLDCRADRRALLVAEIRTQGKARHHAGRTPKRFGAEKTPEWKLFLELLWETGAAQSDATNFKAEDIDWQTKTISYFRQKTGSLAQFTISTALENVLNSCPRPARCSRSCPRCRPATGPAVSAVAAIGRACWVTLHCYRYAWAERAKVAGMPERFAQAALGHNSKAIHRAYAKKAIIIAPTIEDYERKAASLPPMVAA